MARKPSKLSSAVKTLKTKAAAAARRAVSRRRRATAPSASKKSSARPVKSPAAIRRVSVVNKPARGPSLKAARPAARQAPKKPAARAGRAPRTSVVKKSSPTPSFASAPPAAPPGIPAPTHVRVHEPQFSIPTGYGDHRIVLMVKDPWWLFAYWEIQPAMERAAKAQLLPQEVAGLQTVLRVHDVTGCRYPEEPSQRFFDIGLSGMASNWYIQTDAPDRSFIVEIGLLTAAGRFLLLARSNRVTAPRFGPSDVIDERWAVTDDAYWRLFGAAGVGVGSSQGGQARALPQAVFSGGWSSASLYGLGKPAALRGFWCRVNTDLVIHGAAEPKSRVTIQGQPVAVRKDGTFSLRIALPRGTQTVTIAVTSPDGAQTQTIAPVVTMEWTGPLGAGDPSSTPSPAPRHPEIL